MRKFITGLALLLTVYLVANTDRIVRAGVTCTLPFNLQNNTIADATQVMANYNQLVTCLGNAAAAGANSDITSLLGLTTPLVYTAGGSSVYIGGTTAGSANAQTLTNPTPNGFSLTTGKRLMFTAGLTNLAAVTLNVNSLGAINVKRRTQLGIVATAGGELIAGNMYEVAYNGTDFVIMSGDIQIVGEIKYWTTSATPSAGYLLVDGSCKSQTTFASLFAVIGSTYDPTGSTCGAGTFALPDGRGRVFVGLDNQGGSAANRITNATSGCTGTTIGGSGCGNQVTTLTPTDIPRLTTANGGVTDPGHTHTYSHPSSTFAQGTGAVLAGGVITAGTATGSNTTGISVGSLTPTSQPRLMPMQVITTIIKF